MWAALQQTPPDGHAMVEELEIRADLAELLTTLGTRLQMGMCGQNLTFGPRSGDLLKLIQAETLRHRAHPGTSNATARWSPLHLATSRYEMSWYLPYPTTWPGGDVMRPAYSAADERTDEQARERRGFRNLGGPLNYDV